MNNRNSGTLPEGSVSYAIARVALGVQAITTIAFFLVLVGWSTPDWGWRVLVLGGLACAALATFLATAVLSLAHMTGPLFRQARLILLSCISLLATSVALFYVLAHS